MKNYQIVFLSYYYPPIKSPGVFRSYHLSHLLKNSFQKTTVLTTSNRNIMENDVQAIDENIQVVENFSFDYRYLSFLILKNKESQEAKVKKNKLGKYFLKATRSFPINLLVGEGAFFYIINNYRSAKKLIRNNPQTIIYSSFSPYADHVAAWLLKRKYKELVWIADFRDLHVDPTYQNYLWKNLQLWFNKKIISKASFVTTVSEGLAQNLRQFHDDVFVLPNGVRNILEPMEKVEDKFTISYTGAMFQDKRNPSLLLSALKSLINEGLIDRDKIQLLQAGRDVNIWMQYVMKSGLEDIFESKGILTLEDARAMQARSHMNLLLTTSHIEYKGVLTSKIYEYFAAASPVLVIIDGPKDEVYENAITGIEHVVVTYSDDELCHVKTFVMKYYALWCAQMDYPKIEFNSWKDRYYWPEMVKGLVSKISTTLD